MPKSSAIAHHADAAHAAHEAARRASPPPLAIFRRRGCGLIGAVYYVPQGANGPQGAQAGAKPLISDTFHRWHIAIRSTPPSPVAPAVRSGRGAGDTACPVGASGTVRTNPLASDGVRGLVKARRAELLPNTHRIERVETGDAVRFVADYAATWTNVLGSLIAAVVFGLFACTIASVVGSLTPVESAGIGALVACAMMAFLLIAAGFRRDDEGSRCLVTLSRRDGTLRLEGSDRGIHRRDVARVLLLRVRVGLGRSTRARQVVLIAGGRAVPVCTVLEPLLG